VDWNAVIGAVAGGLVFGLIWFFFRMMAGDKRAVLFGAAAGVSYSIVWFVSVELPPARPIFLMGAVVAAIVIITRRFWLPFLRRGGN
jgi:hypothetical protein